MGLGVRACGGAGRVGFSTRCRIATSIDRVPSLIPTQLRTPHFFYRPEYVSNAVAEGFRHTFDIERPTHIRDAMVGAGLVAPNAFHAAPAVSDQQLLLVHTPDYVAQITDPSTLARFLLLDPARAWGSDLLAPFLFATGGTVTAARMAAVERTTCVNLSGGYHHAQADKAEGFCAIADVAIAVRQLQSERAVKRVAIIDLDYHHGNGNALIFAEDESVFTFSMHGAPWCLLDKRNNLDVTLPAHVGDDEYLQLLHESLPILLKSFRPDLVIYVAGSDPFIEDTLGEADLTEKGLFARDRFVTEQVWDCGIPLVVVTAGGYGLSSWRIYFNYFGWLATGKTPSGPAFSAATQS